jgi:hypothetical protein
MWSPPALCLEGPRFRHSETHSTVAMHCIRIHKHSETGEEIGRPDFAFLFSVLMYICIFVSLAVQPPWALASDFQFHDLDPWMSDQPVARSLPKQRTTPTQNKHIHTPNIHALSGIRTHDPNVRTSEDSSCLRPLGYCDRPIYYTWSAEFAINGYVQ